jgi:hypothetical protein
MTDHILKQSGIKPENHMVKDLTGASTTVN